MLELVIPDKELFNDETQEFFTLKGRTIVLEHSLVSVSKWESKWNKPFLTTKDKSYAEIIDYVKCMTITQNVDPDIYKFLAKETMDAISEYIALPMTATTFTQKEKGQFNREIITSEIIYYWMITFNIPVEFQKWHLNRLLTLINVCNIKNQPTKKMTRQELLARNRALNAQRRASMGTKG